MKATSTLIAVAMCIGCLAVFVGLLAYVKPAKSLSATGPDGKQYPVIARLEGRHRTITIISGPAGPVYSANTREGVAIVDFAKLDVLKDKHPEIYDEVRSGVAADAALIIDARLHDNDRLLNEPSRIRFEARVNRVPDDRSTDQFYDAFH
jgi:hypothetical protein